jgi:thiol-disulfide isomerase/thioredoxin
MNSAQNTSNIASSGLNRRHWMLGVAAGAVVAGVGVSWWRSSASRLPPAVEQLLWSSRFEQPDGSPLALATCRGRPLVINFWATWCPPCIEEMPLLDNFFRQNSSKGWQIVGIAIDQPSAVRRFLAAQPVHYPIALGGLNGNHLGRELGNESGSLPYTLVLDAQGRVMERKLGRLDPLDLQKWI